MLSSSSGSALPAGSGHLREKKSFVTQSTWRWCFGIRSEEISTQRLSSSDVTVFGAQTTGCHLTQPDVTSDDRMSNRNQESAVTSSRGDHNYNQNYSNKEKNNTASLSFLVNESTETASLLHSTKMHVSTPHTPFQTHVSWPLSFQHSNNYSGLTLSNALV